jgi:mannose-6-phosphate isomerase-like protein (cupin superfamily)
MLTLVQVVVSRWSSIGWRNNRMKLFAFAFLVVALASVLGADPPGFLQLNKTSLQALEKNLAAKLDANKSATHRVGEFGNHLIMVAYRESDGEAEIHDSQNDIFVVQSGEATLIVGGTVQDGRNTAPGETRGRAISGGEKKQLGPGDVVHIPAKTPHQTLVAQGKHVTYLVI